MTPTDSFVRARAATYVGGETQPLASRRGARDQTFCDGDSSYRNSYFGGTAFAGQEVVWQSGRPDWAMNYWGRVLDFTAINGPRAADAICAALPAIYGTGRTLGGRDHAHEGFEYQDGSEGDHTDFIGHEEILSAGSVVYCLDKNGGLVVCCHMAESRGEPTVPP